MRNRTIFFIIALIIVSISFVLISCSQDSMIDEYSFKLENINQSDFLKDGTIYDIDYVIADGEISEFSAFINYKGEIYRVNKPKEKEEYKVKKEEYEDEFKVGINAFNFFGNLQDLTVFIAEKMRDKKILYVELLSNYKLNININEKTNVLYYSEQNNTEPAYYFAITFESEEPVLVYFKIDSENN